MFDKLTYQLNVVTLIKIDCNLIKVFTVLESTIIVGKDKHLTILAFLNFIVKFQNVKNYDSNEQQAVHGTYHLHERQFLCLQAEQNISNSSILEIFNLVPETIKNLRNQNIKV